MERYVFSGTWTKQMHDYLINIPDFQPMDCLITQLDRSGIKQMIEWIKQGGFCRWFLVDSGAFSHHTGRATIDVDEYISYLNSIDEYFDACAQLDKIPGEFQKPKKPEDYEESARLSWDNFLYMRDKLKSPKKLMPVFHYGESMDNLKRMLSWKDENGDGLVYIGISPANDVSQANKDIYLQNVEKVIAESDNPDVKVHLYGMTSLESLSKHKCYSADSISHRHVAAYAKIWSPTFGVISVSKKSRTAKNKSSLSFIETAGPEDLQKLKDEITHCNLTLEQIQDDSSARVAFTVWGIQQLISGKFKYDPNKRTKTRKLF